jgi:hypothetical protein
VNTSVMKIGLANYRIDESHRARVDELVARNDRLRQLFFFDARKMLLSVLCTDECGVVWPYLLGGDDTNVGVAIDDVEALRAEFAAVVEERRRRADPVKRRRVKR